MNPHSARVENVRVLDRCNAPGLTENERASVEFIRQISHGADPGPTLAAVQALRRMLRPIEHREC